MSSAVGTGVFEYASDDNVERINGSYFTSSDDVAEFWQNINDRYSSCINRGMEDIEIGQTSDLEYMVMSVEQAQFNRLESLLDFIQSASGRHPVVRMDELPTFGGKEPVSTTGVWSWNEDRLLVGEGLNDLRIVTREEWAE